MERQQQNNIIFVFFHIHIALLRYIMVLSSFFSCCSCPRRHLYRKFATVSTKASDWCSHAKEVLKGYESSDDEKKIFKGKRYRFLLESVQNRQVRTTRLATCSLLCQTCKSHSIAIEWKESRSSRVILMDNA